MKSDRIKIGDLFNTIGGGFVLVLKISPVSGGRNYKILWLDELRTDTVSSWGFFGWKRVGRLHAPKD